MSPIHYREFKSGPALAPHIECLWMTWDSERRMGRPPDRIVPDGCPELIVHLADPFSRLVGARWVRQPRAFIAGPLSRPWMIRGGQRVRTLGVRFQPAALRLWWGLDVRTLADRELPLRDAAGQARARGLLRTLANTREQQQLIHVVRLWMESLPRRPSTAGDLLARAATRKLLAKRGQLRMDALADQLGVGIRRLERNLSQSVGLRPKLLARIIRLQAALATLGKRERTALVESALDAGYFDQAHLARDFRILAGRRPSVPRTRDGLLGRHFTTRRRLRAYLGGE